MKPFRDALVEDGIPLAQFAVDDIEAEHARLTGNGVVFTQPPTDIGAAVVAVFDDTCGNLIQLIEVKPDANHGRSPLRRTHLRWTRTMGTPDCSGAGRPNRRRRTARTCAYSRELSTEACATERGAEPRLADAARCRPTRDEWTLEGDRMGTDDKIDNKAD